MNFALKIVCLITLVGCLVSASKQRPPINSDFVNGPWARIGKRDGKSVCGYWNRVELPESIKRVLIVKCLTEWRAEHLDNSYHDDSSQHASIVIKNNNCDANLTHFDCSKF
ncbi:hypothetical protein BpHYR1_044361 [Brachionus plicatilis]|uniref:Uncharacterized protein n=1 Tax=Brachionus plicatilis TaxID=10195 RepID=A0A3M7ST46_BRAPC|nr:hypothetical protein BpHYR1_044361 [Brachionus plicatilis]